MSQDRNQVPPPIPKATVGYRSPQAQQPASMTGREQYNVISDTVVGINLRWRDNLVQGIIILVFVLVGAAIGYFMADEDARVQVALIGALGGLVAGALISGIGLMIYRGIQHMRGRHG
jgi:hypothetical protein